MIADFTKYAQIKATPSAEKMLSVQNPLGIIPKYVHIACDHDSVPYTTNGYLKELWLNDSFGMGVGTNGSTGVNSYGGYKTVSQTPTQNEAFYLSVSEISIYKGSGTVSNRWHTGTEYTVHIYA